MGKVAMIRSVNVSDCRNMPSVERTVLFALASARAEGSHIVKILHGDRRIPQIRTFLRTLQKKGEILLLIPGTKLGDEGDPGSLYLMANFARETAAPVFWERDAGVTVVCV